MKAETAFLRSWSETLAVELKETPVTVTALCPGVTDTDFFPRGGAENIRGRQSQNVMAPQDVARLGYDAMMKGKLSIVTGGLNKAFVVSRRILPTSTLARMHPKMDTVVPPEKRRHPRGEKEGAKPKGQGVLEMRRDRLKNFRRKRFGR